MNDSISNFSTGSDGSSNGDHQRRGLSRMRGEHNLILSSCRQSLLTGSNSSKSTRSTNTCPTYTGESTTSSSTSSSTARPIRRREKYSLSEQEQEQEPSQEFVKCAGFGDFDDDGQQEDDWLVNDRLTFALAQATSISSHLSNLTSNLDEDSSSVTSFDHCKNSSQRNGFHWEKSKMVKMLSTKSLMAINDTVIDEDDSTNEEEDHENKNLEALGNASLDSFDASIDETVAAVLDKLPPEELAKKFLELTQKLDQMESKRRHRRHRKKHSSSSHAGKSGSRSSRSSDSTTDKKKKKSSSSKSKSKKSTASKAA